MERVGGEEKRRKRMERVGMEGKEYEKKVKRRKRKERLGRDGKSRKRKDRV